MTQEVVLLDYDPTGSSQPTGPTAGDSATFAAAPLVEGEGGATSYYKMRCQDDGLVFPGYVIWVVTGAPDDDASEAPLTGSLIAGTVAVTDTWQV